MEVTNTASAVRRRRPGHCQWQPERSDRRLLGRYLSLALDDRKSLTLLFVCDRDVEISATVTGSATASGHWHCSGQCQLELEWHSGWQWQWQCQCSAHWHSGWSSLGPSHWQAPLSTAGNHGGDTQPAGAVPRATCTGSAVRIRRSLRLPLTPPVPVALAVSPRR